MDFDSGSRSHVASTSVSTTRPRASGCGSPEGDEGKRKESFSCLHGNGGLAEAYSPVCMRIAVGARRIEPNPRDSGTQMHECPNRPISLHIRAYFLSWPSPAPLRNPCKQLYSLPAGLEARPNCHAEGRGFESLQPLNDEAPANRGFVVSEGNWNPPTFALHLGNEFPKWPRHGAIIGRGACFATAGYDADPSYRPPTGVPSITMLEGVAASACAPKLPWLGLVSGDRNGNRGAGASEPSR
jgi:hypothetical protein